jgi:hypothetical protein
MSLRYKGAVISATPPTTTGGGGGTAPGSWTLQQQMQAQGAGNWPSQPFYYIEDVFSTYLYTGNAGNITITNGINLSANGGLVWVKGRAGTNSIGDHSWIDTARGANLTLASNTTAANYSISSGGNASPTFSTTGFTTGDYAAMNGANTTFASWTFRKQPKFFDVVTYTGNGSTQNIAHSLGSVPGCVIVKCTSDNSTYWKVWHMGLSAGYYIELNATGAQSSLQARTVFGNNSTYVDPTSTVFTVGSSGDTNTSGRTYVAYIFASNAGGFGLTGTDNVISCGSFTTDGSGNATVNLGYEPQFLIFKAQSVTSVWYISDVMRGMTTTSGVGDQILYANTASAESGAGYWGPTATGLQFSGFAASTTFIYIAIRRGPMKVPTDATKVFAPVLSSAARDTVNTTGFRIDSQFVGTTTGDGSYSLVVDRLRGSSSIPSDLGYYPTLLTSASSLENASGYQASNNWNNTSFSIPVYGQTTSTLYLNYQRAPSFFDEVCYTGTGAATTVSHNLGVAPELMFVKKRSGGGYWATYSAPTTAANFLALNRTDASTADSTYWNSTAPTASVFTVGTQDFTNGASQTFIAYLFASCPGVSKVGSYTGNGTVQTINCGFAGGARFVLIKCTNGVGGNWYVYDTARGMTTLTDPYLLFNSGSTASTATLGSVTTVTTGFAVNAAVLAAINTNAASYIFLAIA